MLLGQGVGVPVGWMKPLSLEGCAHYFPVTLINYPKGANSERKDFLWLMVREGREDLSKACTGVEHPHLWQREHGEAGCMVEAVRK